MERSIKKIKNYLHLKLSLNLTNSFYTMDIESVTINNKVSPYLINAYNGRHHLNECNKNEDDLFV